MIIAVKYTNIFVKIKLHYCSAGQRLITINCIQNKIVLCKLFMCVYCVYLLCTVYINTHTCVFEKICYVYILHLFMFNINYMNIYIEILVLYILYVCVCVSV